MSFPRTVAAFRAALTAYQPAEDIAEHIYAAQAKASIVRQSADVFNALKAMPGLDQDGLRLLVGAAYIMANATWQHGLGTEPVEVLMARAAEIIPPDETLL